MYTTGSQSNGPIILKPLGTDSGGMNSRGLVENDFYQRNKDTPLEKFLPKYYGVEKRHAFGHDLDYIRLENVLQRFENPSVCDLKMGTSTCDHLATEEKRIRERNKYPQMEEIGFRYTGGKIWNSEKNDFDRIDRDWSFSLGPSDYPEAMKKLFPTAREQKLAPFLVEQLEDLLETLTVTTPKWRCFSSSLLIVYESDNGREEFTKDDIGVWAIDFAHAYEITEEGGMDDGYIFGLRNLISYLKAL